MPLSRPSTSPTSMDRSPPPIEISTSLVAAPSGTGTLISSVTVGPVSISPNVTEPMSQDVLTPTNTTSATRDSAFLIMCLSFLSSIRFSPSIDEQSVTCPCAQPVRAIDPPKSHHVRATIRRATGQGASLHTRLYTLFQVTAICTGNNGI